MVSKRTAPSEFDDDNSEGRLRYGKSVRARVLSPEDFDAVEPSGRRHPSDIIYHCMDDLFKGEGLDDSDNRLESEGESSRVELASQATRPSPLTSEDAGTSESMAIYSRMKHLNLRWVHMMAAVRDLQCQTEEFIELASPEINQIRQILLGQVDDAQLNGHEIEERESWVRSLTVARGRSSCLGRALAATLHDPVTDAECRGSVSDIGSDLDETENRSELDTEED